MGTFAVDKVLEFMGENGDDSNQVVMKTDQEEAIRYLVKNVVEARAESRTLVEESPVGSSIATVWWRGASRRWRISMS